VGVGVGVGVGVALEGGERPLPCPSHFTPRKDPILIL
jgi:hypothetical protein